MVAGHLGDEPSPWCPSPAPAPAPRRAPPPCSAIPDQPSPYGTLRTRQDEPASPLYNVPQRVAALVSAARAWAAAGRGGGEGGGAQEVLFMMGTGECPVWGGGRG